MVVHHYTAQDASIPTDLLNAAAAVYAHCFRGSPWNEPDWTTELAVLVFENILQRDGDVFLAVDVSESEVLGFGMGYPMEHNPEIDALKSMHLPEDSYWFSDVGTHVNHRRNGIGTTMIRERLACAKRRGFKTVTTRTLPGCMQHHLLLKHGFSGDSLTQFDTGGKESLRILLQCALAQ